MNANEYESILSEVEKLILEQKTATRRGALEHAEKQILALKKQIAEIQALKNTAKMGDWKPLIKRYLTEIYELDEVCANG